MSYISRALQSLRGSRVSPSFRRFYTTLKDKANPSSAFQSSTVQSSTAPPFKVTVIGSGNWGTTTAKIIAENTRLHPMLFHEQVNMWVFEETIAEKKLTEIINTQHENIKYLPGVTLPTNIMAIPDLITAVRDSNLLVFNLPHQFLPKICSQLKGHLHPQARAISCLKGLEVTPEGCTLLCDSIAQKLDIPCGALSGANLAPEIAREKYSETTIAYRPPPTDNFVGAVNGQIWKTLFHRPYFHVRVVEDVAGVSLGGALKNIVALAAGFVEGKGWGDNAKAAIMRRGLIEMIKFGQLFYKDCNVATFTHESAGVADLITTCAGGRNVRVGAEMARSGRSATEVEKELLNGQSAQGVITTKEVYELLENKGLLKEFPLFEVTYQITFNGYPIENLPALFDKED